MAIKTILITGATDGIGKQTALELAGKGAEVLIHGRSPEKAQKAAIEIIDKTGNDKVKVYVADFSSLEDVRRMSEEIRRDHNYLDVLINNAGVYSNKRIITDDGFELTFQVNYLSHFLLTNLILDILKKSAPSRIINVSSVTHQSADFDIDNLQGEVNYSGYNAYSISKLCNLLFTFELAERLRNTGVTVNALHPGVIGTKLLFAGFSTAGADVKEGAETPVFLAAAKEVEDKTGKYFVRKRETRASSIAYNEKERKDLWDLSCRLTGLK
ncbi:MAG: SDR family oxidoreductase [Bacillota bacterium]